MEKRKIMEYDLARASRFKNSQEPGAKLYVIIVNESSLFKRAHKKEKKKKEINKYVNRGKPYIRNKNVFGEWNGR